MPVLFENPLSFEIEKMLIALPKIQGKKLSLIDPNTGFEIYNTLVNIPQIGLTFQETPSQKGTFGFVPGNKSVDDSNHNDPLRPTFEPEAILILDVGEITLPDSTDTKSVWILQVTNKKDEKLFAVVAKVLSKHFNDKTIIISCIFMPNVDPDITDSTPPKPPKFNNGALSPVGISRTSKTPIREVQAAVNAKKNQE